jgi:hypothetical protein
VRVNVPPSMDSGRVKCCKKLFQVQLSPEEDVLARFACWVAAVEKYRAVSHKTVRVLEGRPMPRMNDERVQ